MLTRRQLLLASLGAGALLGSGALLATWRQPRAFVALPGDRVLLTALVVPMLGTLPLPAARVADGALHAISSLSPAQQHELRQLFDLLQQPLLRRWLAGVQAPWAQAAPEEVAAFLQRWRYSRLALLRAGYQGLHAVCAAAAYGDSASWPQLGYRLPASMAHWL